jgi:hypothetical protein
MLSSSAPIRTSNNSTLGNVNGRNLVNNNGTSSRRPGKSIAHEAGSRMTVTGSNEAGTTGIAFRTTVIVDISARTTAFASTGCRSLVVGGYPRFQYQGYWFSAVDPWPEYWANNWYDTDVIYVTYVDNGYYMFNRRYPNVGIAINISM